MEEAMALLEDAFKGGNIMSGLVIGVGALIALPLATALLRPMAKTAIKGGMIAYDQGSHLVTALSRATSEMITEVKREMHEESRASGSAAGISNSGGPTAS
jgi:hypothetical protein